MLSEADRRKLETLVVEYVLVLRSAYMNQQNGRPPMNYWEQFSSRMRSAARQTTRPSEWVAQVQRRLQIPSIPSRDSRVLIELVGFCDEHEGAPEALLDIVDRETPLIIAMSQKIVEERKAAPVAAVEE